MELTKDYGHGSVTEQIGNADTGNRKEMGISPEVMGMIAKTLTEFYKNPGRAAIRETIANARDAVERGHGSSVTITSNIDSKWTNNPSVVITDDGCGMSFEEVRDVFAQYGNSSKRDDMSQIGALGLGAKSPLAAADAFTVRTVKDGMMTFASIVSETDGNYVDPCDPVPVDEPNGTVVTIPIRREPSLVGEVMSALEDLARYSDDDILTINGKRVQKMSDNKDWVFLGSNEGIDVFVNANDIPNWKDGMTASVTMIVGGFPYNEHAKEHYNRVDVVALLKPGMVDRGPDMLIENGRYAHVIDVVNAVFDENMSRVVIDSFNERYEAIISAEHPSVDDLVQIIKDYYLSIPASQVANGGNVRAELIRTKGEVSMDVSVFGSIATRALLSSLHVESDDIKDVPDSPEDVSFGYSLLSTSMKMSLTTLRSNGLLHSGIDEIGAIIAGYNLRDAYLAARYGFARWDGAGAGADRLIFQPTKDVEDYLVARGVPVVNAADIRAHEKELRKAERVKGPRYSADYEVNACHFDLSAPLHDNDSDLVDIDDIDDIEGSLFIFTTLGRGNFNSTVLMAKVLRSFGEIDYDNLYVIGCNGYNLRHIRKCGFEKGRVLIDKRPRVMDYRCEPLEKIRLRTFEDVENLIKSTDSVVVRDAIRSEILPDSVSAGWWGVSYSVKTLSLCAKHNKRIASAFNAEGDEPSSSVRAAVALAVEFAGEGVDIPCRGILENVETLNRLVSSGYMSTEEFNAVESRIINDISAKILGKAGADADSAFAA